MIFRMSDTLYMHSKWRVLTWKVNNTMKNEKKNYKHGKDIYTKINERHSQNTQTWLVKKEKKSNLFNFFLNHGFYSKYEHSEFITLWQTFPFIKV